MKVGQYANDGQPSFALTGYKLICVGVLLCVVNGAMRIPYFI